MALITIDIPDAQVPRVRAALAEILAVAPADVGVPEAKAFLVNYLKNVVRAYEQNQARAAADANVSAPPDIT